MIKRSQWDVEGSAKMLRIDWFTVLVRRRTTYGPASILLFNLVELPSGQKSPKTN